jgi:hypothetical protein
MKQDRELGKMQGLVNVFQEAELRLGVVYRDLGETAQKRVQRYLKSRFQWMLKEIAES